MDIIQLKCFISVARTLSFSEAARRNYVSQSTVSRYIRDLEKEFGVKLFERSRREVELTNEGKLLLPYMQDVIDTINKASSVISRLNSGSGGRLRLAYDAASVDYPVKCLSAFTRKYPDIAVDMISLSGSEIAGALNSTDYDFYFMLRDMLPDNDSIASLVTSRDNLKLVVPYDFEVRGGSVKASGLKNQRFVLLSETESPILYMEIMDIFRTFHFSPDSIVEFDDVRSVFMAVSSGMGISVLPSQLVKNSPVRRIKSLEFGEIETDLAFVLAWRKDNSNPAAQLFLKTVRSEESGDDEDEYII